MRRPWRRTVILVAAATLMLTGCASTTLLGGAGAPTATPEPPPAAVSTPLPIAPGVVEAAYTRAAEAEAAAEKAAARAAAAKAASARAAAARAAAAKTAAARAAAAQPAGPADAHCAAAVTGVKHIYVNIRRQHLWACIGPVLIFDSAVTTGASALTNVHDATPTGTFEINGKYRNVHLVGHDANGSWNDKVAYWIPYIGGTYGFHDASWQTIPFGSPLYTTKGSHGCVHVQLGVIARIYGWAPIGTRVTIT